MNKRGRFIILVTHVFPYPPSRGTELRILKLLRGLRNEGYRVVLVLCEEPGHEQYLNELRKLVDVVDWVRPKSRTKLGRRLPRLKRFIWPKLKPLMRRAWIHGIVQESSHHYDLIPSTVGDAWKKKAVVPPQLAVLVAKLARKYDPICVIAEYIFLTECFALLAPQVLKVVDTNDVFSLRNKQVVQFGIEEDPWNCTAEEERAYLLRADAIIAIQEREASVLSELVPERRVLTVGLDFEVDSSSSSELGKPDTIAVVASDSPLNVHGLKAFFAECWPLIKAAHPAARLNVVGSIGGSARVEDEAVTYTLRSENLGEVYQQARVVLNTTAAGTGLKVKSVEALSHGKPLVAWPLGVDGLDYRGEAPYIVCESWPDFAASVVRILQSETDAQALRERALEYAKERFQSARVYSPFCEYLREGGATKPEPQFRRLFVSAQ